MFKVNLDKLFTIYPLIYLSIGFVGINFLSIYEFININNIDIYILLVIYFGIVALAYLLFKLFNVLILTYEHYKKKICK